MKKIVRNAISLLLIISLLVSSSVIFVFADSTQDGTLAAGDVFYLGEYPQSRVIDDAVIASLNSINSNWISYQYLNRDGQTNDDTHLQKYLAEFDGIVLGKQSA